MARTLTAKIIADHLVGESEEEIELGVDEILLEDATGTMACLQFEQLGLDRVARADGLVRRPQRDPVRQPQSRGPRVSPQLGDAVRRALLAARERDLPLPAPRAVRAAGPRPRRRRLAHDDGGRARDARDRSGRDRGGGRDGRPALRRREARWSSASSSAAGWSRGCSRRTSCSSCSGGGACAAAAGCIFEFHGDGRRDPERDRPRDDLQHGDGDRRDDGDLPLGRADARVARRPGPGGALARAGRRPGRRVRRDGDDRPRRASSR